MLNFKSFIYLVKLKVVDEIYDLYERYKITRPK